MEASVRRWWILKDGGRMGVSRLWWLRVRWKGGGAFSLAAMVISASSSTA